MGQEQAGRQNFTMNDDLVDNMKLVSICQYLDSTFEHVQCLNRHQTRLFCDFL